MTIIINKFYSQLIAIIFRNQDFLRVIVMLISIKHVVNFFIRFFRRKKKAYCAVLPSKTIANAPTLLPPAPSPMSISQPYRQHCPESN